MTGAPRRRLPTVVWVVIGVLGALLVVAAALLPMLIRLRAESDRRAAWTGLTLIGRAQRDFCDHDLDGNGVADYWTKDVRGLAGFTLSGVPLLDVAVAAADDMGPAPQPFHGHFFGQVELDESGRKYDQGDGVGDVYVIVMYPMSGSMNSTSWIYHRELGHWMREGAESPRPHRWMSDPARDGWSRVSW